jgi:hypothetical protein
MRRSATKSNGDQQLRRLEIATDHQNALAARGHRFPDEPAAERIRRELEGMHPYTLTISGLMARRHEFLRGALEVLDAAGAPHQPNGGTIT